MAIGNRQQGVATGPPIAPRLTEAAAGPLPLYVEVDHGASPLSGEEDGAGFITVQLPAPMQGYALLIERIFLRTTSSSATSATVYVGPAQTINLADYTANGNQDVADYAPPLLVPSGSALTVVWEGASADASAIARVQWRMVMRPDGVR